MGHFCMDVRSHFKFSVPKIELTSLSLTSPTCFLSVSTVLVNGPPNHNS